MNVARYVFLNPTATQFFSDWTTAADDIVAALRTEAGTDSYDRELTDLVGELSTCNEGFATRSAAHDVRFHRRGLKDTHHPTIGDLYLSFEALACHRIPGLFLIVYGAEPGSASEDGLRLLARGAATLDATDAGSSRSGSSR